MEKKNNLFIQLEETHFHLQIQNNKKDYINLEKSVNDIYFLRLEFSNVI